MLMRLLIVLGTLAFSIPAYSDDLNRSAINRELQTLNPVKLRHSGRDGVWFSEKNAEIIYLIIDDKLSKAFDLIDTQSYQIKVLKSSIDSYKESVRLYSEYAEYNRQMLEVALKYFPKLEQPKLSWYETRTSSYIYGVLTGVAIIVTSAYVLDQIDDNTR